MNYIYLLWLLQLKRYIRSRVRMFASLGQPLLLMYILGSGIQPLFQKAGQGSYIQFLCPGVVGTALLFTSVLSGLGVVWDRQFGFFKTDSGSSRTANISYAWEDAWWGNHFSSAWFDRDGRLLGCGVPAS